MHILRDSASSFHWLSSSIFSWLFVCPASITSPLISTIWWFRAYKPYIFCEDMILATCQCQHIFCCWVEPRLLLSSYRMLQVHPWRCQACVLKLWFYIGIKYRQHFWSGSCTRWPLIREGSAWEGYPSVPLALHCVYLSHWKPEEYAFLAWHCHVTSFWNTLSNRAHSHVMSY